MAAPRLIRYNSLAEFRRAATAWNDLWQRGLDERPHVVPPSACAESIAAWIDHFAPQSKFIALAVEHDGHLVAGLPLVQRRMKHTFSVGSLPVNASCWAGDLVVEPMADVAWALEIIAAEIRRLPWPLLWFDGAPLQSPRWSAFLEALG